MYRIKIGIATSCPTFWEWRIYCPLGYLITRSVTRYHTENSALRWAKYWAKKLSSKEIKFEEGL